MTTREQFALAFGVSIYSDALKAMLEHGEDTNHLKQKTVMMAVEMADLLIAELQKTIAIPPPKK